MDDSLVWTWECMRKKKLSKAHWCTIYKKLLPLIRVELGDFEMLCGRKSNWTEVEAIVRQCCSGSLLGKRLFGSLQQYVTGAKVGTVMQVKIAEWLNAGQKVTRQMYEAAVVEMTTKAICK